MRKAWEKTSLQQKALPRPAETAAKLISNLQPHCCATTFLLPRRPGTILPRFCVPNWLHLCSGWGGKNALSVFLCSLVAAHHVLPTFCPMQASRNNKRAPASSPPNPLPVRDIATPSEGKLCMVSNQWTRIAVQFHFASFLPTQKGTGTIVLPVLEKAICRQPAELSPGARRPSASEVWWPGCTTCRESASLNNELRGLLWVKWEFKIEDESFSSNLN